MNRVGFLVILLIVSAVPALYGQLQWGFRTGLSLSAVENNTLYHQLHATSEAAETILPGLDAALVLKVPVRGQLSLIAEVHYLQKGGTMEERFLLPNTGSQAVFEEFETDYRVTSLELPVLLQYQLQAGQWQFGLFSGMSYGHVLSRKLSGDPMLLPYRDQIFLLPADGSPLEDDLLAFPLNGHFRPQDWSIVAGLSASRMLDQQELVFDARYLHGFTDWRTEDAGAPQLRSRVLILSVGVLW